MTFLIVLSALLAASLAKPIVEPHVHVHQDTAGNYKVTFDAGDIQKTEEGTNGHVVGTYSYVDGDGHLQTVKYTAGEEGFVATGTNFPVPALETSEVIKAREEHLAAHKEVLAYLPITDEFHQSGEPIRHSSVLAKVGTHLIPVVKYVPYEVPIHA